MPFAYFFLGEYSSILLMSTLTVLLFLGGWLPYILPLPKNNDSNSFNLISSLILGLKVALIFFSFVWVRATFPRWKYTQLILICWTSLLPLTLGFIILVPSIIITFF